MMRSRASAYLLSFSSRSIFALRCRSSKSAFCFFRASSSLSSSSSSRLSCPTPCVASFFAMVGFGFRLSTLTCGLKSCFNGTTPCASSQWLRLGFSAESHICFCNCKCCARRSDLVSLGAGSVDSLTSDLCQICQPS